MVLLNVEQNAKIQLKDLYSAGQIVQHYLDKAIETQCKDHEWDGYIHPSHLDWTKTPEKQLMSHITKGIRKPIEAKRRFRFGDLIHYDCQDLLQMTYPGLSEVRFCNEEIMMHGTCDYIAEHKKMGVTYFELKSYSKFGRDATNGKKLLAKIEAINGEVYRMEKAHQIVGKSFAFNLSSKDLEEIAERLMCYCREKNEAEPGHLTQNATYGWAGRKYKEALIQKFDKHDCPVYDKNDNEVWETIEVPPPDRLCVVYIDKLSYSTKEFWFNVKKDETLLKRARNNYVAVLKQLRRYERES